ncbi:putative F-box/LRR-repeat protein-like [Capsicum annuum]|nr:putative F-box/LRR-repeat protein-like [Capsicum annuum]
MPHTSTDSDIPNFIASANRDLYYWRFCEQVKTFRGILVRYDRSCAKDVDLWVHFAIKLANVEELPLGFSLGSNQKYELPQFAFKNTSLKSLILMYIELNPYGSFNWSSLVFLSIASLDMKDGMLEKVLSGCPNLKHLELDSVLGISRLEVTSVKLTYLCIKDHHNENDDLCLEIFSHHLKYFELLGYCDEICLQQRNVSSLVSANLFWDYDDLVDEERNLEEECRYLKELLYSVAHVENLGLDCWFIEFPPSSRKFLKIYTALERLDFPGICSFLQSSPDLETLTINWCDHKSRGLLSRHTNEDEQSRRFETHKFNCSLLHLKTIKFIDFHEPLSGYEFVFPFVKYLLKNATVLEEFVIAAEFEGNYVPLDYVPKLSKILLTCFNCLFLLRTLAPIVFIDSHIFDRCYFMY